MDVSWNNRLYRIPIWILVVGMLVVSGTTEAPVAAADDSSVISAVGLGTAEIGVAYRGLNDCPLFFGTCMSRKGRSLQIVAKRAANRLRLAVDKTELPCVARSASATYDSFYDVEWVGYWNSRILPNAPNAKSLFQ